MKKRRTGTLFFILGILTLLICLSVQAAAATSREAGQAAPDQSAASSTKADLTFAEMFPDENFRAYVTGTVLADCVDSTNDADVPSDSQMAIIESWTQISVVSSNIVSLEGLSFFHSLNVLNCYDNQLTELDISNNQNLEGLECSYNRLTELNLAKNPALTALSCGFNQLTALELSPCSALMGLDCASNQLSYLDLSQNPALQLLYCSANELAALDITHNTSLELLDCSSNRISALDVSQNSALKVLECSSNQLAVLDTTQNQSLASLRCNDNQLTQLDLTCNLELDKLYCFNNHLPSLELGQNKSLRDEYTKISPQVIVDTSATVSSTSTGYHLKLLRLVPVADLSRITMEDGGTLDLSSAIVTYAERPESISYCFQTNSPNSDSLAVTWSPVFAEPVTQSFSELFPDPHFRAIILETVLKDSSDPKGETDIPTSDQLNMIENCAELSLWDSEIASLEGLSYFYSLKTLTCSKNNLTELNISQNPVLTYLACSNNHLTELNISSNPALTTIYCGQNQLTYLDVSRNPKLWQLICKQNKLESLDVSSNPLLRCLDCMSNQLTELNLTQNGSLEVLLCSANDLTELDLSHNTALTSLFCGENLFAELDVSQNTALTTLNCMVGSLKKLDVTNNLLLNSLNCASNQLTELDVSQNTALTSLTCYSNQLTELDLSNNSGLDYYSLSPQSILNSDVFVEASGSGYKLVLTELVPGIDLSRVVMNDGGTLDTSTGIVTYTEKPETVSYLYQTNSPNSDEMIVNWTPVFTGSTALPGDLDGDGKLSSADVVMLAKYLVGAVTLTDDQIAAADLNGDGAVTAADTVLLAKKLLAGN